MTFLQPYILWGLPLLLVPIIIHLVNRLRHRPQPWAAMRFIVSATQSSVSQAKLKQFLVLLFRVLAVLALIIFLGRPLAGGWLGWALAPAPDVVVLVLDRSASMETKMPSVARTRREQAIAQWTDALQQFPSSTRIVLLDSAGKTTQELPGPSALNHAEYSGSTETSADMPDLLLRAFNHLLETRAGAAEVWIASDLQASNWQAADGRWEKVVSQFASLPQKVRFRMLALDDRQAQNTSLTLAEALRRSRGANAELAVTLDVQRNFTTNEPLVLATTINGASSQITVEMPELNVRTRPILPLNEKEEAGWGSFALPSDGNDPDNRVYFAFEPEKPAGAVIVSEEKAVRPLQLAAADFSKAELEPAPVMKPDQIETEMLSEASVLVWTADLPRGPVPQLNAFVESGGVIVFFPPSDAPAGSFNGFSWGRVVAATTNQTLRVTKWNDVDGPLAKTEEGLSIPLQSLDVMKRAAISGGGTTLAAFADGAPFLVRKPMGRGAIFLCATAPRPDWSSLSDGTVLVPLIQRLHSAGARRLNAATVFECGKIDAAESAKWTPLDSSEPKNPAIHAGVYRANGRLVAVNRPSAEDTLESIGAADVAKLFGPLTYQLLQDKSRPGDRLQGEIWRFFVFAMLLFLLVEGLLILPSRAHSEPPEPIRMRSDRATLKTAA